MSNAGDLAGAFDASNAGKLFTWARTIADKSGLLRRTFTLTFHKDQIWTDQGGSGTDQCGGPPTTFVHPELTPGFKRGREQRLREIEKE